MGEKSLKKLIQILLILLLLGALIFTAKKLNQNSSDKIGLDRTVAIKDTKSVEEAPKINFKAPTFNLKGLDEKQYDINHLSRPLVINFWASWCGPCKIEAPELVKLYKKYQDRIEIYAVNITSGDSFQGAQAFSKKYGFTFPVLLDPKDEVTTKYNIAAIPTTYFVNQQGIIVDQIIGFGGTDVMEQKIKKLARQSEGSK